MIFRRFRLGYLGLFALCLMPSCTAQPPNLGEGVPKDCAAEEFQRHLWQPKSFLDALELPKNTRVILPDMAVTMDYVPSRLNIAIGKSGRIERVYCG